MRPDIWAYSIRVGLRIVPTDLDSLNKLEYILGWIFNSYQFYFILSGLNIKLQISKFPTLDKIPSVDLFKWNFSFISFYLQKVLINMVPVWGIEVSPYTRKTQALFLYKKFMYHLVSILDKLIIWFRIISNDIESESLHRGGRKFEVLSIQRQRTFAFQFQNNNQVFLQDFVPNSPWSLGAGLF